MKKLPGSRAPVYLWTAFCIRNYEKETSPHAMFGGIGQQGGLPSPGKSRALLKDTAWSLILGCGVHTPATRYSVFERLKKGKGEGAHCDKLARLGSSPPPTPTSTSEVSAPSAKPEVAHI